MFRLRAERLGLLSDHRELIFHGQGAEDLDRTRKLRQSAQPRPHELEVSPEGQSFRQLLRAQRSAYAWRRSEVVPERTYTSINDAEARIFKAPELFFKCRVPASDVPLRTAEPKPPGQV